MFAFGTSISCAIFQRISDALKHLIGFRVSAQGDITNYLDHFLFIALMLLCGNFIISQFLLLCQEVRIPIVEEKTVWGTLRIVFLGVLLDGYTLSLAVPVEKRNKTWEILQSMVDRKKVMVRDLQSLCGLLNFLNKAIFPGRVFTRRMYTKYVAKMPLPGKHLPKWQDEHEIKEFQHNKYQLKKHHHICLDHEFKADCQVWLQFLQTESVVCRPMVDLLEASLTLEQLFFYSDVSAGEHLGYSCVYKDRWIYGSWEPGYIGTFKPSIEYLELFMLCTGILTWQHLIANARIVIFCDNMATVHMVNSICSSCRNCMFLLRVLVLNGLKFNRRITVRYVSTKNNYLSDALSRGLVTKFRKLAPHPM